MNFILAQIFGGIALILVVISYFLMNKEHFLFIQIIANVFYGLSFIVNDALVAGLNTFISILRVLVLYLYERKDKTPPIYLILIFSACYITIGVIFFKSYYDIIVIITPILFTIAMWVKKMQLVRYLMLLPNAILVFYAILNQVYTTALLDLIEVIAIIVALITYYIHKKKEREYLL